MKKNDENPHKTDFLFLFLQSRLHLCLRFLLFLLKTILKKTCWHQQKSGEKKEGKWHINAVFNHFQAHVSYLYPLKMSENQRFSVAFRSYENGTFAQNVFTYLNCLKYVFELSVQKEKISFQLRA